MRVHLINDGAVSEHDLEADAVRMHGTLLDEFDTASVGCKVATDLTTTLGAQVKRHHVAEVFSVLLQSLEDAACLSVQNTLYGVQSDDLIHLFGADDNLIVQRNTAADQARVATLWNNSNVALVAVAQSLRDLLSGRRCEHHGADADVLLREVHNKGLQFVYVSDQILLAEYLLELADICVRQDAESGITILLDIHSLGHIISRRSGGRNLLQFGFVRWWEATLHNRIKVDAIMGFKLYLISSASRLFCLVHGRLLAINIG